MKQPQHAKPEPAKAPRLAAAATSMALAASLTMAPLPPPSQQETRQAATISRTVTTATR